MTSSTNTTADHYHVLGISPDARHEEIRSAYRAKLRLWHPDLVAGETEDLRRVATQMTARLNQAYGCLSDPDRRAAYDTRRGAGPESTRRAPNSLLVVTPRMVRCEVTPGDIVRFTLEVQADSRRHGGGLQVRTSERLVATSFTVAAQAANSLRLEVQLDTSRLDAHRIYRTPIVVTWGALTGTATLVVRTGHRKAYSTSPSRRSHGTRRSGRRVRDATTISLGGMVLPLLVLAGASGLMPVPAPANSPLIAALCAGMIAATIWLLMSSRLMRHPDRLARIGVLWSHLMRWSGWVLIGFCAVFLGIPAIFLALMAVFAVPFFGLVVVALISGRFDSQNRCSQRYRPASNTSSAAASRRPSHR